MQKETIELKGKYISGTIDQLPFGRINKRYTGIGATTLELEDQTRNSVIVVPTKSLAGSKAVGDVFYLGSSFQGRYPDSMDRIEDAVKDGKRVKIMAVADSFVKEFYQHKELFLKNFHLLIDEVDSFQSEASYRLILNDCIDIYKLFAKNQRTMISATLQDFLEEEIAGEPIYEIKKPDHKPIKIELINSRGDFHADLAELIKQILTNHPSDKILIGYNSIDGIMRTIASLNDDEKVGVLCSNENKNRFPLNMQSELVDSKLQKQVTFMTSAYFVGVDILDNAHVIAAGDISHDYRMLPKSKIIQILGRVRDKNHKNFFLFNTNKKASGTLRVLERSLMGMAEEFKKIYDKLIKRIDKEKIKFSENDFANNLEIIKYFTFKNIQLIRRSKADNKTAINYLAIDYLLHQQKAANEIYTNANKAEKSFLNDRDVQTNKLQELSVKFCLKDEARYNDMRENNKRQELLELESYLESFCWEGIIYGIGPECPARFRDPLADIENTKDNIGECETIKNLVIHYANHDSISGLRSLASKLRFLRCWTDKDLKKKLEQFLDKGSNIMSKEEARRKISPLVSSIVHFSIEKVDLSNDKKLTSILNKLFNIKMIRRTNNYEFISRKRASDYLRELNQGNKKKNKK